MLVRRGVRPRTWVAAGVGLVCCMAVAGFLVVMLSGGDRYAIYHQRAPRPPAFRFGSFAPAPRRAPAATQTQLVAAYRKELRFYVYPVPPRLLYAGLPADAEAPRSLCRGDPVFNVEWAVTHAMDRAPERVDDPAEANVFFIPALGTCVMHECAERAVAGSNPFGPCRARAERYLMDIVEFVRGNWPYFDRSGGADHLVPFGHEAQSFAVNEDAAVRAVLRDVTQIGATGSLGQVWLPTQMRARDIVVLGESVPGPRRWMANLDRPKWAARRWLVHFRGTVHADETYSMGARQALEREMRGRADVLYSRERADDAKFADEVMDSKFCLHVGGWMGTSGRLAHLLALGCVPVIIADGGTLPHADLFDWGRVAVKVSHARVGELYDILARLDLDGTGKRLEAELAHARWRLAWNGSALDTLLDEVALRHVKLTRAGWGRPQYDEFLELNA